MSTVVLLPPIGLDKGAWPGLTIDAGRLEHYEYPGHGTRRRDRIALSLPGLADELVASYGGELDLVGVSMGGMVAMHAALRHPDRVRSMVLACTGAAADPETMARRADAAETLGMAGVIPETLERWFTESALTAVPAHPGVAYAREALLALDPGTFADAWRAIARHDVRNRLGEIQVPTTCIAGTLDKASPLERMRAIVEGLPHARPVAIDGPHMLQLECPAEFSEALADHLREVGD